MKTTFVSIVIGLLFGFQSAHAQYIGAGAQFGIGLHGGAGMCSYGSNGRIPEGIVEIEDEQQDLMVLKKELLDEKNEAKRDLKDLDGRNGKIATRKSWIERVFKPHVYDGILKHMAGTNTQDYYKQANCLDENSTLKQNQPWPKYCKEELDRTNEKLYDSKSAESDGFFNFVDGSETGKFHSEACGSDNRLIRQDKKVSEYAKGQCSRGLEQLKELIDEKNLLAARVDHLGDQIEGINEQLSDLRKEKRREIRNAQRDGTEADYCYSCQYKNDKPISTTEKVGSLLLGGLGAYLGYKGYKYGVDQAAKLGWPVAANPAVVVGGIMPSVAMGIYGATNGIGAGGCGAGGTMGMYGPGGLYGSGLYPQRGGAFGYPPGMGGMMGGGMYMPGMGTYGIPGPYGLPGFGGGTIGVPMAGGYPMAGGGMMMGGIGGVGFLAGGGGGMMMGGMPMAGGGMYMGGMPMAGGGMMGGFPMAGGGGLVGGLGGVGFLSGGGGMMGGIPGGYAGGGMMMGGYPMAGGGIGFMMGGYPMAGGGIGFMMGGIPGGFGGGGGMAGLQMQQRMMQMQQQQTQLWIQQQQQQQQDYYNRQQTVGQLQNQLVQIQMQIQQVQYGVYGSGYSSGSGGGTLPYPGQQLPYPGGQGGPGYQPGFPGQQPYPGQQFPVQPGGPQPARGGRF